MNIGFLHPGSMGVSIAAATKAGGHSALWASEGRGQATKARADEHGLEDAGTVADLSARSDIIISICPPAAAEPVAATVARHGFAGIFVDANAVSPERMARIAEVAASGGADVVDGGIIGLPAWQPGRTTLHLSGPAAGQVAACFKGSALVTNVVSDDIGAASALKMCYAALTKGTAALLAGILATAEELGVREALNAQWDADGAGRAAERAATVAGVTPKAWRWVDEMEEIARTFEGAGQPGGFHQASAATFKWLSGLKDGPHGDLEVVLKTLQGRR